MTDLIYSNVEFEILAAATTLWQAGVNGSTYTCFLNVGDYDRLLAEFGEPIRLLTFTRFTVQIEYARAEGSFVAGGTHWTYLGPPHRLQDLAHRPAD